MRKTCALAPAHVAQNHHKEDHLLEKSSGQVWLGQTMRMDLNLGGSARVSAFKAELDSTLLTTAGSLAKLSAIVTHTEDDRNE